ncbi:terminase large subunit [Micrococcus luteus]|uniref:terminase large subunit n=1 Tax=Micrococcus luteus TaxID=1270 RepID=UPI0001C4FFE9|nr:terminase TerL endonuclease subunit [Micrococcus luteus]EFD50342.1 putative phage terminase, large subunit [Micrococcus luteus SK58]
MATKNLLDGLPVPYDALVELGMSHEQILEAAGKRPRTVAFQADQHPDAWFDVARAQRALRALGAFTHTKGRWAGVHLRLGQGLDPWQVVWILAPVFGWVYFDAELDRVVRVIRRVWVEIPRKNGKSTISSAISGVLLLADQEPGAEVYNAAGSKEQAARVFEDAKRMLSTSKAARSRVEPLKDVVRVPRTASILRVLSSVAETAHGLNVSGAVVDEVHTLRRKAGLVDALETGVGARDQPLLLYITTADEAEDGTPYDEKHTYTLNVASGIISDPSFYGVVWGAEEGDDPFAESTWAKASPGFPKSPNRRYMETEAKKARNSPRELAVFKQLALNLRTASTSRWLDIGKWDELTARPDRARLRGRRAWAGLDLSATSDFTAWAVWVESTRPGYQLELLIDYWVPEDRVEALQEQLQVPLQAWVDQGYVHATEGDVIDYAAVKAKAVGDARHYDLQRISYDRMFAGHIVQEIDQAARGVDLVPVGQGFVGIGPAAKEFERLINGGLVILPDDPVSRWMALWVETKTDETDNIRPVKPNRRSSMRRIDGIQAAVTGLDGWVRAGLNTKPERKVTVFGRR